MSYALLPPSVSLTLPVHPLFFCHGAGSHRALHSFPTRRSSDLTRRARLAIPAGVRRADGRGTPAGIARRARRFRAAPDRKSTRLNSSHTVISYAVFCLKKKKINDHDHEKLGTTGVNKEQKIRRQ